MSMKKCLNLDDVICHLPICCSVLGHVQVVPRDSWFSEVTPPRRLAVLPVCISANLIEMDRSPLAKLPPELRNRIYDFTLTCDSPIKILCTTNPETRRLRAYSPIAARNHPLALTETCKQLHEECTQLFYAVNIFVFPASREENSLRFLDCFITTIGQKNALVLRSVLVHAIPVTATSLRSKVGQKEHFGRAV